MCFIWTLIPQLERHLSHPTLQEQTRGKAENFKNEVFQDNWRDFLCVPKDLTVEILNLKK